MFGTRRPIVGALTSVTSALLLMAVLGKWPYGFYQILRFVVFGTSAFLMYFSWRINQKVLFFGLGFVATIFNPVLPLRFERNIWVNIDFASAVVLLISTWWLNRNDTKIKSLFQKVEFGYLRTYIGMTAPGLTKWLVGYLLVLIAIAWIADRDVTNVSGAAVLLLSITFVAGYLTGTCDERRQGPTAPAYRVMENKARFYKNLSDTTADLAIHSALKNSGNKSRKGTISESTESESII